MIEIQSLTALSLADLKRVANGYVSDSKFVVLHTSADGQVSFDLQLVHLDKPYVEEFDHDNDTLQRYESVLNAGYSFGAYDQNLLVGLVIGEPHEWNRSLWVWEFHVIEAYRNRNIGKQLMEHVAEKANHAGFRTIVAKHRIRMCRRSKSIANSASTWKESIFPTTRMMTTLMAR